jgi:hypothetical protein
MFTCSSTGEQKSSVTGRIRADGTFDGCFYAAGMLYHLEPASRYFINPLPFHSLIYQSRDVDFNSSFKIAAEKVQYLRRKIRQVPEPTLFQVFAFKHFPWISKIIFVYLMQLFMWKIHQKQKHDSCVAR